MRMLSVLPRVTERTRERVAREFDDLGPDVCMNSIMRDLQRHNPELLDMASKWARALRRYFIKLWAVLARARSSGG